MNSTNTSNGQGGILPLMLEFLISMLIIGGGGYLLTLPTLNAQTQGLISASIGAVIAFWFMRRNQDTSNANLLQSIDNATNNAVKAVVAALAPTPIPAIPAVPVVPTEQTPAKPIESAK